MTEQANALVPARAHETVTADEAKIRQIAQEFIAGQGEIKAAEQMLATAKSSLGTRIVQACFGVAPVSEDDWAQRWKPVVEHELKKAGYKQSSIGAVASNIKVAVIAITNGITPKEDDTFTSFVKWARDECKQREYITTNGGGRKGGGETQVTRKPSAKEEALLTLAKCGDEVEDEGLRRRVAALRYLIDHVGWAEIIAFANKKSQELNKPLKQAA